MDLRPRVHHVDLQNGVFQHTVSIGIDPGSSEQNYDFFVLDLLDQLLLENDRNVDLLSKQFKILFDPVREQGFF